MRHAHRWFQPAFAALIVSVLVGSLIPSNAPAQVASNTNRSIRPLVSVAFQNPVPSGDPLAVGLFDTGSPSIFIAPETNQIVGLTPTAGTAAGNVNNNYGVVSNPATLTVSGFLGEAVGGPEVMNKVPLKFIGPSHIFSTDTLRSNANPVTRSNLSASLTYFNAVANVFSVDNIGTAFVGSNGANQPALTAEVDPINGSYLPFPFDSSAGPPVGAPFLPGDQTTSNVSFYQSNSVQVPTQAANSDPGFLTVLTMIPTNFFTGAVQPSFTNTNPAAAPAAMGTNGASLGNDITVRLNAVTPAANPATNAGVLNANVFGLPAAAVPNGVNLVVDTGAPTSGGGLIGADALNGFGQYYNFSAQQLLLFGPIRPQDQAIVGPGILFNVDRSSIGLQNTAVNQLATNGLTPVENAPNPTGTPATPPNPNPNGAPTVFPSAAPEQSATIFRTQLTHSNASYVSGIDALGLTSQDQLLALSLGGDTIPNPLNGQPSQTNAIMFAVDRNSQGLADDLTAVGGGVMTQAALGKQSANIYLSTTGNPLPAVGVNAVRYSGDLLGLGPNAGPSSAAAGRGQVDELRDFVIQSQNGYYNTNVANVQGNLSPTIIAPGDNRNPGASVAGNAGVRGDVYGANFDTYFTLDQASPSRLAAGVSAADVLVNNLAGAGSGFHVFAPAATLGLNANDQINTLALDRPLNHPTQTIPLQQGFQNISMSVIPGTGFDPNINGMFDNIDPFHGNISDLALFTLGPGSPDLGIFDPVIGGFLSSADVFVTDFDGTFSLYDTAESLGLNPLTDTITGMKPLPLSAVPEPGPALMLILGAVGLILRRPSKLVLIATCARGEPAQ